MPGGAAAAVDTEAAIQHIHRAEVLGDEHVLEVADIPGGLEQGVVFLSGGLEVIAEHGAEVRVVPSRQKIVDGEGLFQHRIGDVEALFSAVLVDDQPLVADPAVCGMLLQKIHQSLQPVFAQPVVVALQPGQILAPEEPRVDDIGELFAAAHIGIREIGDDLTGMAVDIIQNDGLSPIGGAVVGGDDLKIKGGLLHQDGVQRLSHIGLLVVGA